MFKIKDLSCAHTGCMYNKIYAPCTISRSSFLYTYIKKLEKSCRCTGSKTYAPGHQIVHTGCRVHPYFRTLVKGTVWTCVSTILLVPSNLPDKYPDTYGLIYQLLYRQNNLRQNNLSHFFNFTKDCTVYSNCITV